MRPWLLLGRRVSEFRRRDEEFVAWSKRSRGSPHERSRLRQGFGGLTHISPSKL
jgi:hypothetical protein